MTDIVSFLLDRIAEDETDMELTASRRPFDGKARWLAECAAKREIIELHAEYAPMGGAGVCERCDLDGRGGAVFAPLPGVAYYPCRTLRALAQPHAAHPDFDPAWKATT